MIALVVYEKFTLSLDLPEIIVVGKCLPTSLTADRICHSIGTQLECY